MKETVILMIVILLLTSCAIGTKKKENSQINNIHSNNPCVTSNSDNDNNCKNDSFAPKTYSNINKAYPENKYNMDVDSFVARKNDAYIHYIYTIVNSTNWPAVTGMPYNEYKGFESAENLSSDILMNVFFTATDYYQNNYFQPNTSNYLIPVEDIHIILDKYFSNYFLDIHDVQYNFSYLYNDQYIVSPGFNGITYPLYGGYIIDSINDNGDGTISVTIYNFSAKEINNNIVPTSDFESKNIMLLKPEEYSCKIISFEQIFY